MVREAGGEVRREKTGEKYGERKLGRSMVREDGGEIW